MSGLGSLVFELRANAANFISGMNAAQTRAKSGAAAISVSLGDVAKAAVASNIAVTAAHKAVDSLMSTFSRAGQAIDAEASLGVAAQKFHDMRFAVESAGDSFAEIPSIIAKLSTSLGELKSGDGKAKMLAELGLSAAQLRDADPSDALYEIARGLQSIDNPAVRARVGTELLGKGYKDAAAAIDSFANSGKKQSGVTVQMLQNLDALADEYGRLQTEAGNAATKFMGSLAPAFIAVSQQMLDTGADAESLSTKLGKLVGGLVTHATLGVNILAGAGKSALFALSPKSLADEFRIAVATFRGDSETVNQLRLRQQLEHLRIEGEWQAKNAALLNAGVEADEKANAKKAQNAKDAAERIKRLTALLASGGEKAAVDKIAEAFARVRDETDKATLSAREYRLAQFKALGADSGQVARYTIELDSLEAAERAKKLKDILSGLDAELEAIGKTDDEKAMLGFIERLKQAGASGDQAAEALERFKQKLSAEDAARFAAELAAVDAQIDAIGKSAQDAAAIEIRAKYKDNPEQLSKMLAANARRAAATGAEEVRKISDELDREAARVGASPLTQYVLDLKETQRLNPQVTDEFIASAAARKQAILDATAAIEEAQSRVRELGNAGLNALEQMAMGSMSASQGFDAIKESIKRMIVQAALIAPLQRQIDALVKSMGQLGTTSNGSGGGSSFNWGALFSSSGSSSSSSSGSSGSAGGGFWSSVGSAVGSYFGFAGGGSPSPNSMVEVAEGGKPELYRFQNKTYLLTGSQSGVVQPARSGVGDAGGGVVVNQTIHIDASGADPGVSERIQQAMAQTKAETLAAVQANANRGGSFAASVGRRR